jgi:predicted porin
MNKKLIALALASAFAAPAAMAADGNVVIYGNIGMSMDYVDGGTTSAATQAAADTAIAAGTTQALADARLGRTFAQSFANSAERRGRISSNNSYIGFKGSEDLGNGLSAIWQWEFAVAFDTQNSGDLAVSDSQEARASVIPSPG